MRRQIGAMIAAGGLLLGAYVPATGQEAGAKTGKPAASKTRAAPGFKTCNYRFPDGERRSWTCRKEEPCCAWDAIKYVKCGSTVTNCL